MTVVLLLYLLFPFILFGLLRLFRVRSKRLLFGLPLFLLSLPLLLGFGAYAFRSPIQQGKYLAELGPLLNLAFPADDLYDPLVSELAGDDGVYSFSLTHQYVGSHGIFIELPGQQSRTLRPDTDTRLSVHILSGDRTLFQRTSDQGLPYYGPNGDGFIYINYRVPEDVPVGKPVSFEVQIVQNDQGFLHDHAGAQLIVRKRSDL